MTKWKLQANIQALLESFAHFLILHSVLKLSARLEGITILFLLFQMKQIFLLLLPFLLDLNWQLKSKFIEKLLHTLHLIFNFQLKNKTSQDMLHSYVYTVVNIIVYHMCTHPLQALWGVCAGGFIKAKKQSGCPQGKHPDGNGDSAAHTTLPGGIQHE